MGDADAAAIRAARGDWVSEHLEIYLTSGGTRGHIMDVSAVGGRALTTHCLIKCVGRKSAKVYVRPLIYGNVGGEIVIVASKGRCRHASGVVLECLSEQHDRCADRDPSVRGHVAGTRRRGTASGVGLYGSPVPAVSHLSAVD